MSNMKWIDMHCDTLSEMKKQGIPSLNQAKLHVDKNRLIHGNSGAQFFACYVNAKEYIKECTEEMDTETKTGLAGMDTKINPGNRVFNPDTAVWDSSWKVVNELINLAYKQETENFGIVHTFEELEKNIATDKLSGILTVEEGGVLNGRMERLEQLYERGIRLMTLTWNYQNCIGNPNNRDKQIMKKGLTTYGKEVVERMNELGMLVDVSHLSDGGFWDCVQISRKPIVASHSNARSLCPHPRNMTDEMLHALGEKGGVVGVNFYSVFLCGEERRATVDDIVHHIRHMINCAGEDAVALGTDFDGFEDAALPEGIQGVQDMERLWDGMRKKGITSRQIEKIACDNILRVLRETW